MVSPPIDFYEETTCIFSSMIAVGQTVYSLPLLLLGNSLLRFLVRY